MRIAVHRDQFVCIGADADDSEEQKKEGCNEEFSQSAAALLVRYKPDEKSYGIAEYDDCQVVGNLDMVCLYLEVQCHSEECGTEYSLRNPRFPALFSGLLVNVTVFLPPVYSQRRPIREYHGGKHPRQPRDSHHLRVVADLDNLHVV